MHLLRDRTEGIERATGRRAARGARRARLHDDRRGAACRSAGVSLRRALRRLCDGRVLPRPRPRRAGGVRRPHQARDGVPRDVGAARQAGGTRGLPGRHLLHPLAVAGTRVVPGRFAWRGHPDRAAGHRDARERHLGVHPHERDLDLRRADRARGGCVQRGQAPGDGCGTLGIPRRRLGPDTRS